MVTNSILTQERNINYARIQHDTADGNLLRGWRCRRTGRSRFQPRTVSVGAQRETRGKGPGFLEIAGHLQAAFLGWVVGYPVRPVYSNRLESPVPLRCSILPRSGAGAVFDLSADGRRGVFRASAGRANVHALPAAGKSAVRDSHRLGRQGHHRNEALGIALLEGSGPPQ